MTIWDYPAFAVLLAVVGCLLVATWLIRVGNPKGGDPPDFECDVCGRKQRTVYARDWRFCPFCGTRARPKPPRW